jgi:hypothetical protein
MNIRKDDINAAQDAVERAIDVGDSKQPRFNVVDPARMYRSIVKWVEDADLKEPDYKAESRTRDTWLSAFWRREPHLAGVINSVSTLDSNRGWSVIGGRNQVNRYTTVLHNWQVAPSLDGWRAGSGNAALSFYTTDMGAITEVLRDGRDGPWRGSAGVDPTACELTPSMEQPLKYQPSGYGSTQLWDRQDFYRIASMPAIEERYNGLGFCAVSRCLDLAKIMVAVYQHDLEMLLARAPRGIMAINGVTDIQWQQALEGVSGELDALEMKYFANVIVLAQSGMDEIKIVFTALSQLPANFDLKTWTDLLMYGYALCFGYDPREFWPVSSGSLGTATETETQHNKAVGKGGLDFILEFQEQIQRLLPDSIEFQFEQRDDQGELIAAQVSQAWSDVAATLAGSKTGGVPIIAPQYVAPFLVDHLVIPPEWTEYQEEAQAEDTDAPGTSRGRNYREKLLTYPSVQRAIHRYPDEPIVRYRWPTNDTYVIWERGRDAMKRRSYPSAKYRQEETILYDRDGVTITEEDVQRAITNAGKRTGDPEIVGILEAQQEEAEE